MALTRVPILSPNYSSRNATVRLIVLHTAEGSTSYQSLGNYFKNPASQVSSHVGIDDTPGTIGEYVARDLKAWTAANANPVAVQAELCGFAAWDANTWAKHSVMLQNCAKWVAEEASVFGIPLVKLNAQQAQSSGRGICQHSDLGTWGGNHSDCGPNFPIDDVIKMAGGAALSPPPVVQVPPYPGVLLINYIEGHGTKTWQAQMVHRGWSLTIDDKYGNQSEHVCTQFQQEKGLHVDGIVGPETWNATWTAPIT